MSVQNLSLNALNANARFSDVNKFTVLAQLVDAHAKMSMEDAPTHEEYQNLVNKAVESFPETNLHTLNTMANAWGQLLVIYMENFYHSTFSEKDTPEFKEFLNVLESSKGVEKGIKILQLQKEHFEIPCYQAQRDLPLNNLETTLAINYGALEQIINGVYYFKEMDVSAKKFCGLDRQNHAKVIDLIQDFAQHQYDFVYDLLWGTSEETKSCPSYSQRNQVLNISNLYKLLN
ncbi:hypothetical protein MUB04_15435 [Acinetobacter indicus]|uniref:hypothetical protein n=1 Tax=Acinetobacter TaxID=469 RepID=UPI0015D2287E|nr:MULTISPECIES: hypothetical protein [Acinetobacter]MCP0917929.1 hypothetical protein [Acinetobacter indicus]